MWPVYSFILLSSAALNKTNKLTLAEVGLHLSYADMKDEYVSHVKVIFDAYVRNYDEYNPHLGHFKNNMKKGAITNPTPGQVLAFTSLTYKEPKKNTLLTGPIPAVPKSSVSEHFGTFY